MPSTVQKVGRVFGLLIELVVTILSLLTPDFLWRALGWHPDRHVIVTEEAEPFRPFIAPTLEDVPAIHEAMRASFATGRSRLIRTRLEQLTAMQRMIEENEEAIIDAIQADLSRPRFEALYYDVLLPLSEVKHMISGLYDYVEPEKKGFNLLTFPSDNRVQQEPYGTALIIGTWNYSFMLTLVPLCGAIAAGNTVVLKPSNVAPNCAKLIARLCGEYLDPRIVTVIGPEIPGDRHTTGALLELPWDKIFFTGSPTVGRVVAEAAAKFLTPCTLELGGKNPVFVLADCDVDLAAKRTVWGRFMNAGQQCISPDYVMVEEEIADAFIERCVHYVETFYASNDDIGRIINDRQMRRLEEMLATHGGEVVVGGGMDKDARFVEPSVIRIGLDSPTIREETFGPVLWVTPINRLETAINHVNAGEKPLSMYVFAGDQERAQRVVANTSAGGVTINGTLFHVGHSELPFGGVGASGMGAYHGKATFDCFSHPKPVLRKRVLPDGGLLSDPFFLYPPWRGFQETILRIIARLA